MGRIMALKMARRGARVVIYDLDERAIDEALAEIRLRSGARAYGYVCDISDRRAVYETADRVRAEVGNVDILVNNAALVSGKRIMETTDEQIEKLFGVNVLALYWVTRSFLPHMMGRNEGHIVTMASAAGIVGVSKQTDYSASKHAAIGFTESLRVELKKFGHGGVRTTIVNPFYVSTGMFRGAKTRFNRILPIMEPEKVSGRVVRAIENDRQSLRMPLLITVVPLLDVLPASMKDWLMNFFGVNDSMDEFVGRARTRATESGGIEPLVETRPAASE